MKDLPERARRAGIAVTCLSPDAVAGQGPFDLVLCDAPCSGSGAWRRSPAGKWALDAAGLAELTRTQSVILRAAAPLVAPGGVLAYATCSLLDAENGDRVAAFLDAAGDFSLEHERRLTPLDGGDGFYLAVLRKS